MPTFLAVYVGANQTPKAIVVADAICAGFVVRSPSRLKCPKCIDVLCLMALS